MRNAMPMPKLTPSGDVSHLRASTKRSLRSLNSNGKCDGSGTLRLSLSDFYAEDDSSYSVYSYRARQGLLYSLKGSVSLKGTTGK
jgi:hypothetical protein